MLANLSKVVPSAKTLYLYFFATYESFFTTLSAAVERAGEAPCQRCLTGINDKMLTYSSPRSGSARRGPAGRASVPGDQHQALR